MCVNQRALRVTYLLISLFITYFILDLCVGVLCGIVFHPVSWTNQTSPNLDKL